MTDNRDDHYKASWPLGTRVRIPLPPPEWVDTEGEKRHPGNFYPGVDGAVVLFVVEVDESLKEFPSAFYRLAPTPQHAGVPVADQILFLRKRADGNFSSIEGMQMMVMLNAMGVTTLIDAEWLERYGEVLDE